MEELAFGLANNVEYKCSCFVFTFVSTVGRRTYLGFTLDILHIGLGRGLLLEGDNHGRDGARALSLHCLVVHQLGSLA